MHIYLNEQIHIKLYKLKNLRMSNNEHELPDYESDHEEDVKGPKKTGENKKSYD